MPVSCHLIEKMEGQKDDINTDLILSPQQLESKCYIVDEEIFTSIYF